MVADDWGARAMSSTIRSGDQEICGAELGVLYARYWNMVVGYLRGQGARDPEDLAGQATGPNHQYPDGFMLFLGTMFAPTKDRHGPGLGFTHVVGDLVTIGTPKLGALVNRVNTSDRIAPWTYGAGALMATLAKRGLLTA